ncbi:MAG: hypothetical protein B7Y02_05065 [Rhodobacterales bacterium 17-64-5]|nr:MAG: hypothetical protein B7Y02_05065 [Rhodobacterales bacterium 17-64-5]
MSTMTDLIEHIRSEMANASSFTKEDTDLIPEAVSILNDARVVSERTKAVQAMSSKHLSVIKQIEKVLGADSQ